MNACYYSVQNIYIFRKFPIKKYKDYNIQNNNFACDQPCGLVVSLSDY